MTSVNTVLPALRAFAGAGATHGTSHHGSTGFQPVRGHGGGAANGTRQQC